MLDLDRQQQGLASTAGCALYTSQCACKPLISKAFKTDLLAGRTPQNTANLPSLQPDSAVKRRALYALRLVWQVKFVIFLLVRPFASNSNKRT